MTKVLSVIYQGVTLNKMREVELQIPMKFVYYICFHTKSCFTTTIKEIHLKEELEEQEPSSIRCAHLCVLYTTNVHS